MGLSSTINLVANGLKLTQTASSLVAANVANASTDGYTAKTLGVTTIYANTGLVGFTTSVSRAFDQEIFDQLLTSTASTAYLDTQSTYLSKLDALNGTTANGATLSSALASFSSDLQTLATQPSNSAAQVAAVNSAESLAQTLNSLSGTAQSISAAVNGDIDDGVMAVNELTSQIAKLNTQIVSFSAQGIDVTGMQDQRDSAILKLSTYMDIQVRPQSDGSMRVATTSAMTLVDAGVATQISRNGSGQLTITKGAGVSDLFDLGMVTSGSLAALDQIRQVTLPQFQNQLDQVAASLAQAMSDTTTAGTAASSAGANGYSIDLAGLQSGNMVHLTYTDSASGLTKTYSFINSTQSTLADNVTADPNDIVVPIDLSGGMAGVVSQISTVLGASFAVSNPSGTTLQILDDGAAGTIDISALTATKTATATQSGSAALPLFVDETTPYTGNLDGSPKQITGFAGRISVNSAITADPALLVNYSSTTESNDPTRPNWMVKQLQESTSYHTLDDAITPSSRTITAYANSMVSYWGDKTNNVATELANQKVVRSNLTTSLSTISKVTTDTELAKLIQLQAVYGANAKVLSTLKDMLNTLLSSA